MEPTKNIIPTGYDLHTIDSGLIPAQGTLTFDTGIAIKPPQGTYGRIASRSGLAVKHNIETKAGVIDPDYTGTLKVVLHNFGNTAYTVNKGDRIAQLILENFTSAELQPTNTFQETDRGDKGFGSTGFQYTVKNADKDHVLLPDIDLTNNVPEYTHKRQIRLQGTHQTLGLIMQRGRNYQLPKIHTQCKTPSVAQTHQRQLYPSYQ